nr:indolethylamine N-methyltransferase-like [Anolis sagrei ordinatus]
MLCGLQGTMEGDFTGKETYHLDFDPKGYFNMYKNFGLGISPGNDERLCFILEHLHKTFAHGGIRGDTLIDIGSGPSIYQLLSACESFKEIIASDLVEKNREEMQKWLRKDPKAFNWTPMVKYVCQIEGNRERWMEKEEKLRRTINQVLPCDMNLANPFNPLVVPPADCVLSTYCLEVASKDLHTYRSGIRKIGSLVKSGGHLVLVMALGGTYYMVGPHKFSCIYLTPEIVKEAIKEAGFDTVHFDILNFNMPMTYANGQNVGFLVAQKHQEA